MNQIKSLLIGGSGIGLVEATPVIAQTANVDISGIVQTVIQLVIGVVTLLGMFKKKKV
jgi:hypothetical protein